MIAGLILLILMSLFVKCCAVHTPSTNPNKPPALNIYQTLTRPSTLIVSWKRLQINFNFSAETTKAKTSFCSTCWKWISTSCSFDYRPGRRKQWLSKQCPPYSSPHESATNSTHSDRVPICTCRCDSCRAASTVHASCKSRCSAGWSSARPPKKQEANVSRCPA